ncbi:MAG: DNA starvation/stationary phase protection protein Dps [Phycisphaerales bacterium JB039]
MIQSGKELEFETRNDLPGAVRSDMVGMLNALLADASDLASQLKQAHWNVKGPSFIALHKLFDDIVDDVREYGDELAERAVSLGGIALGTVRMAAERSTLVEYPADISAGSDHVRATSDALATFGAHVRESIKIAEEAGDADTADLCTEISRGIDKWLWFVEAHGQAEA